MHYYLGEAQWIASYGRGEQVILDSIFNLVNAAKSNSGSSTSNSSIWISPSNQAFYQEEDYFITPVYNINKTGNLTDYSVELQGAPDNTEVVDKSNSGFRLRVHSSSIKEASYNIDIKINATFELQVASVYYTTSSTYQKVVLLDTNTEYNSMENAASATLEAFSELKIIKQDSETKEKINNTVFHITSDLGYDQTIKIDGELYLTKLMPAKYTIVEVESNENYIVDLTPRECILNPLDKKEIIIENNHKKGYVEIIKFDKDEPDKKLEGVEFEVRDKNGAIVDKLVTDREGYAISGAINIGAYDLVETKTLKNYRIATGQKISIKYNEILKLDLENEKCKGFIKVIKVDKDNNEIKLSGVQFIVLDDKGHLVDFLKTDENGEAFSKELPVGHYLIKEISTVNGYVLSTESEIVLVKEKEITEVQIGNEKEIEEEKEEEPKLVKLPRTGM